MIKATRSLNLSMPMARAPRMTVKLSHDRKVRSLAKKTLGSTRVGNAMRLPRDVQNAVSPLPLLLLKEPQPRPAQGTGLFCLLTGRRLKQRLARHFGSDELGSGDGKGRRYDVGTATVPRVALAVCDDGPRTWAANGDGQKLRVNTHGDGGSAGTGGSIATGGSSPGSGRAG